MRRRIAAIAGIALALGASGLLGWALLASGPTAAGLEALRSDEHVRVETGRWITFTPASGGSPASGLVVYPGGRVDARGYAPLARRISERGHLVVIVPVRLNLAILESDAANAVMRAHPEIRHWAVGGHSLGGVAASLYAAAHPGEVEGLVLWASYPPNDALRTSSVRVLSVCGSRDAALDGVRQARPLLPDDTRYVVIEGGDHPQFGAYDAPPELRTALIGAESQWDLAARATAELLASLASRSRAP
ncbi:MAG: alpha/beta hydrolase [Deltaproteobacteria bacterium]|nr:alpha/beta hydrolase [Deltaproteobacteria bacterium]